jgi:hypothetical protein
MAVGGLAVYTRTLYTIQHKKTAQHFEGPHPRSTPLGMMMARRASQMLPTLLPTNESGWPESLSSASASLPSIIASTCKARPADGRISVPVAATDN